MGIRRSTVMDTENVGVLVGEGVERVAPGHHHELIQTWFIRGFKVIRKPCVDDVQVRVWTFGEKVRLIELNKDCPVVNLDFIGLCWQVAHIEWERILALKCALGVLVPNVHVRSA